MSLAEKVERLLESGGEADDLLRDAVALLHERLGHFARISFVEGDRLVPGPTAGAEEETTGFPIVFQGGHVGELEVGGTPDAEERALLHRIAGLLAPYALVGWDTGGEAWSP